VVERQDPRELLSRPSRIAAAGRLKLDMDRAVGLLLPQHGTRIPTSTVEREREPHRAVERRWPTLVGPKAELGGGSERERPAGNQLERLAHSWHRSGWYS